MFPSDFKELLSAFNSRNVRYLVIGGYAVIVHSQPRATKDLDLLISPDTENAKAVYAALAEFGAPLEGLTPADFIEPGMFFRIGMPPLRIDILSGVKGVDFNSAWERRMDIAMGDEQVPVISSSDLIESTLAAGRPQDLLDVAAIRETQQIVEQMQTAGRAMQENQTEPELKQEEEHEQEENRER